MRINIVTESRPGWVLRQISENLQKHLPASYITDFRPDCKADVNLYINYALFKSKTNQIDVGWFTHREFSGDLLKKFNDVAREVDYCISMCNKTAGLLPQEKTRVILPCADSQFFKSEIVFGCAGKNQPSGRKHFDLIEELSKIDRIKILFSNQKINWIDMPEFYNSIDYLLILSDNEGGPMPVLEAIACGKPVIAPDVGWCWDFPIIRYNGYDDLKQKIKLLATPVDCWEISGKETYDFLKGIYEVKFRK
jgi:hypothetical protein